MNSRGGPDLEGALGLRGVPAFLKSRALEQAWPTLVSSSLDKLKAHGRFEEWMRLMEGFEAGGARQTLLDRPAPTVEGEGSFDERAWKALGPWKKGPFEIFGGTIDAEWRSDLKWARVTPIISPLRERKVLDVGTGNGYFLLRAAGEGAAFTLGLEPSGHYCAQFIALNRVFDCPSVALLPATSSQFCQGCQAFDTVLSMGVLYHRRSPLDHLMELKGFLKPGGELVLETIVIEGAPGQTLVPKDRYAQMRNVWFLPSTGTLVSWLERLGFIDIVPSEAVPTTENEQRTTSWSTGKSLRDFLDPQDATKTIEGYPAPTRVIIVAKAP